jgi:hypothetical protein
MEQYLPYAVIIMAVFSFFVQFGLFVRPEQLEKKHREILEDSEYSFSSVFRTRKNPKSGLEFKEKAGKRG